MILFNTFFTAEEEIFKYFGYKEDWVKIPLHDDRDVEWHLEQDKNGSGKITYCENFEKEAWGGDKWYQSIIYTQRFLPKWVYRTKDYTMISYDTQTDGVKYLGIFDNKKEIKKLSKEVKARKEAWDKHIEESERQILATQEVLRRKGLIN